MIKEASRKTKAEVDFEINTTNEEELEELWCISFLGEYLVRVTSGWKNLEKLKNRNKYSRRLLDLPKEANEVLLWRQIRRMRAKSLHIFKNSNDNNMRSATVYFANEEDLLESSRFAICYYDNKLRQAAIKKGNSEDKSSSKAQEEPQDETKKRSSKSLGKMREVEQDLIRESSKIAQRRAQNRAEETKVYEASSEDEA